MQGIVMAGGFGVRLRPLTINIPKPMVPLANIPVLGHVINLLKKHEIDDLIVLLYFQPEIIKDYLGDGSKFGVNIMYLLPEEDLGTAGAVKYAQKYIKDTFFVVSADLVTDIDLKKAYNYHKNTNSFTTIVLYRVQDPLHYGVVITDKEGRITRFLEKPTWGEVFSDKINAGIYIVEPEALNMIPTNKAYDFSKDLFPKMLDKKVNLHGYSADRYWRDIGTIEEYLNANKDFSQGKVEFYSPELIEKNIYIGENSKIDPSVELKGKCIIGKNCIIEKNTEIKDSSIGNNCHIGEGVTIIDSIIWDEVKLYDGVSISDDIIGKGTTIGREAYLLSRVYIGDNCKIGEKTRLGANIKVWPDKIIESESILSNSLVWGDRWMRELFTESRISGLANTEISPEFGARLGSAFGAFLGMNSSVVISRDSSRAAGMIERALIGGLMSVGVDIVDNRISPPPLIRNYLRAEEHRGGIHVRLSPYYEKNVDIIFFGPTGRDLTSGKTKSIERLFFMEDYRRASFDKIGRLEFSVHANESYRENFLEALDINAFKKKKTKIVIDYGCGLSAPILPGLLGTLGCEVISLNAYLNYHKLMLSPEDISSNLKQLSTIVTSLNADAGFMINQSAESIIMIDEKGRQINHQEILAIVTELFLRSNDAKSIAVPISATNLIDKIASKRNVKVIKTMNSHRAMIDAADMGDVRYVGGTRGGFIFKDFLFACDGMFAVAKIVELMIKNDIHPGELLDQFKFPVMLYEEIICPKEIKGNLMRFITEESSSLKRSLLDGIKIFDDFGWILINPHREKAAFTIQVESENPNYAKKLLEEWKNKLINWRDRLKTT
ncbi:MAG: NTP transferase domain-containing protein [Candidatus Helarchaeota archaeon]|nr:NTP transferase domain-containing protein [Candidatus Helarchaeota archaeon]